MPAPPIVIFKKKGGHGGHHGGAWKVAYADFVTAMMALFIVLWLMNSSKQIQVAVGGYFKDPTGTSKKVGTNQSGSGDNFMLTRQNMAELKEQLQKSIRSMNDLEKLRKNIEMTVTAEGLRIELLESDKVPNKISVEGHTDAKPYVGKGNYSNWELSADRANAARRLMQQAGLRPDQISQVRGFADQRLRNPRDPMEASNRRISIIVQYLPKTDTEDAREAVGPATAANPSEEAESGRRRAESEVQ
jgi:chemotaxis protein MotB